MSEVTASMVAFLPLDRLTGTLVGRVWLPKSKDFHSGGPCVVALRDEGIFDLSSHWPTMSDLLEETDPAHCVGKISGTRIGTLETVIQATLDQNKQAPYFLAPCDLQVIKAAGVTFAASLIERVIEEQAKGNPALAVEIRTRVLNILDGSLAEIVPGSAKAAQLKQLLIAQGLWSQYLEVGIGPDAEVFTKAPVLSAVGLGADVGIHPKSEWNNPEPEIVLAVDSRGNIKGAALGNDVNLRDFEGRSALLLGKAKDNNASCSIGPFLRLFDSSYNLDDVRQCVVTLEVTGADGFVMKGQSSMSQISRDPLSLVDQTLGDHHQYPDGFMLFLGTMFAPVQDRSTPGSGFTHHLGDTVRIHTAKLGTLVNTVQRSDQITPWTFGVRALYKNIAERGLLQAPENEHTP
jgi:fumarylacetoacetate (FAA) hydrolase family protein